MRFLDASVAQQQAEQQQAEAEHALVSYDRARRQVTVLLLGLIGAIGLALWAYAAQQQATRAKAQALSLPNSRPKAQNSKRFSRHFSTPKRCASKPLRLPTRRV